MSRSKRYKKQIENMGPVRTTPHGIVVNGSNREIKFTAGSNVSKKGKNMAKYTNFNTEPGMSTWVDMPEDYKREFYKNSEALKIKRAKKREREITNKIAEKRLRERIAEMENQLFGKDKIENVTVSYLPDNRRKKPFSADMDASICNFVDQRFFEKKYQEVIKTLVIKPDRPKILLLSDVCGWAWWNKSQYLKMYLADDYEIDVIYLIGPEASGINRGRYSLYITYGYSYVHHLSGIAKEKRVTGMTAHRPLATLKPYMEYAGHCHANSILLLEELKKIVKHKNIYYVPNGVDEEIFKPIKPISKDGKLIAGHVGKKCPQKHQEDIILPAIDAAGVESVTNLNDYTIKRPYCEMASVYQDMDVFIVASDEDGTPNPALEAAACGRPIISNRIGNMPEFIKDGYNGFLLNEMKVEKYVEKLKYLKNNRDKLIEMGENARKTVEKDWTWKKQSENYRKMFRKIVGR